jgi:hypothetical protein
MAIHSKRSLEGYLLIDNRHAPGPDDAQVAAIGQPVAGAGAQGVWESATVTCSHCHRVVILNPDRSRARNYCSTCDHYVCDNPACIITCQPMNKTLDELQRAAFRSLSR